MNRHQQPDDPYSLTVGQLLEALIYYEDCLSERERDRVNRTFKRLRAGAHIDSVVLGHLYGLWHEIDILRRGPDGPEW